MRLSCFVVTAMAGLVGVVGCGSSNNPGPAGTGGSSNTSYENNGEGVCPGSTRPVNDDFCSSSCPSAPSCAAAKTRPIDSCCVLVGEPGLSAANRYLERTTDTKEYADPTGAPPDLGCFDPAGYPAKPSGSGKTATLAGELRPFANGGCADTDLIGVNIEVYTVKRTGDPATDGALDQLQGVAHVIDANDTIAPEDVTNCVDKTRYNRQFSYPGLPMDTELVIKTYGTGWTPLYTYNVYISENDPDYDATAGTYQYHVRALASDDFNTIPTVAIGKTITPGNGAVGGEIHDCGNVRLKNARVDISLPRLSLEYFNPDEDNPLPAQGRHEVGTDKTALYTALDIQVGGPEGSYARISASGLISDGDKDKLVSLGYYDVRVFPDAVTSLSLRGLRPFQVP
jgi:hypothetical protein